MKKEVRKSIVLLIFFGLLIISIPLFMWLNYKQSEEALKKYESYLKGTNVIYLGREGCSYCKMFQPVIDGIRKDYNVDYKYVDIDELKNGNLEKALKEANIDPETFGTPTTIIAREGEIPVVRIGYMDREALFKFLKENSMIPEDAQYQEEYPNIHNISYSEYDSILKSGVKSVVVVGQTNCSHCIEAKPALDEIAKEYNIPIHYLNYTDMNSTEREALQKSVKYFEGNENWGTPLFLILENGNSVDATSGFANKETVVHFLQSNGII